MNINMVFTPNNRKEVLPTCMYSHRLLDKYSLNFIILLASLKLVANLFTQ